MSPKYWRQLCVGVATMAALTAGSVHAAPVPVCSYHVVKALPHDPAMFTEGLFYRAGMLYESAGLPGASRVVVRPLDSAKPVRQAWFDRLHFGEGIVNWGDTLIGMTWQDGIGYRWDLGTLAPKSRFGMEGEGWGLTQDGRTLYQSDGSPTLLLRDPESFAVTSRLPVTADGQPVVMLNELEWIEGEIWANVWMTDRIARIDPRTGHVRYWIDLTGLRSQADVRDEDDVLNGIAYDPMRRRVFVTGKHWSKLFEITVQCPGEHRQRRR